MTPRIASFLAIGLVAAAVWLLTWPERVPRPHASDALCATDLPDEPDSVSRVAAKASVRKTLAPRRSDPSASESVQLDVVREDGSPIAGASVRVAFDLVSFDAETDANGRAILWAFSETPASVTVSRSDFVPETRTVDLDPGTKRFVVPTGMHVEALVFVGDSAPEAPIEIGLVRQVGAPLSAISDRAGRIEFFNLAAWETPRFTMPKNCRRVLTTTPPIVERVNSDTPPVGRVPSVRTVGSLPTATYEGYASQAGPDGEWVPVSNVIVHVNEIHLIPIRVLAITVLETNGEPVAGVGVTGASGWSFAFRTDPKGRTLLKVDEESLAGGIRQGLLISGKNIELVTVEKLPTGEDSGPLHVSSPSAEAEAADVVADDTGR